MKTYKFTILPSMLLLCETAHAFAPHTYANSITAHNIAALQHSITSTAIQSFDGSISLALPHRQYNGAHNTKTKASDEYGRAPMYGTMSIYGEYNDDSRAGRSGGDTSNAALNSIWFNWQHLGDDVNFDNFPSLESEFNTFTMGLAGGRAKMGNGISEWGIYVGYVGGDLENKDMKINSHGGYFGVYNGFDLERFSISTTINGGAFSNSADTHFGTDDYSNFWVGGAINAKYDMILDSQTTLRPELHAGYTWIQSEDYTSASGAIIDNDAFSMFELTPGLRLIRHIGAEWYGSLNAKYVIFFANGGDMTVNDIKAHHLNETNFFEYSITLEKSVHNLNISGNIGRHEGPRDGWIGGLNIKYIF